MPEQTLSGTRQLTALLVGTDEMLLYTRKAMLEKQGFAVRISPPSDIADCMHSEDADVVIACHTLKPKEIEHLLAAARLKPRVPALISFTKRPNPSASLDAFDAAVWSLADPAQFLSIVESVLRPRTSEEDPAPPRKSASSTVTN